MGDGGAAWALCAVVPLCASGRHPKEARFSSIGPGPARTTTAPKPQRQPAISREKAGMPGKAAHRRRVPLRDPEPPGPVSQSPRHQRRRAPSMSSQSGNDRTTASLKAASAGRGLDTAGAEAAVVSRRPMVSLSPIISCSPTNLVFFVSACYPQDCVWLLFFGLVYVCMLPPAVTLQPPAVTLQPPSVTHQPPSVTHQPPS